MRLVCSNCDNYYSNDGAVNYVKREDGTVENLTFLCTDCKLMFGDLGAKEIFDNLKKPKEVLSSIKEKSRIDQKMVEFPEKTSVKVDFAQT